MSDVSVSSQQAPATHAPPVPTNGSIWRDVLLGPAARALIALLLVIGIGSILALVGHDSGAFFKFSTHRDMLRQSSVYGLLACGMTLVIITGGIDLAVGSILAVTAVAFSLMSIHLGWSPLISIPLCCLLGAACGTVSGTLTSIFRLQPFIATLAMMVFARGFAKWIADSKKVSSALENPDGTYRYVDVPQIFRAINAQVLHNNLSVVTVIAAVFAILAWVLLAKHRWGRQLYAIGGNEEAARLSGVPVRWAKTLAYSASGLLAAVAGMCQAAQEQQGDPDSGVGYELTAIAMVVIGGTRLSGGRGGMGLTLLGVLTFGYLDKILSINAISESGRLMLTGAIIVGAVLAQRQRRS